LYISVNISPRRFRGDRFHRLDDALAMSGARATSWCWKSPKGTLMVDPAHAGRS
jgi:hypothetical protein